MKRFLIIQKILRCGFLAGTMIAVSAGLEAKEMQGTVTDHEAKPVEGASVVVMSLPDSAFMTTMVTDSAGRVRFDTGTVDSVLVTVQMLGYERQRRSVAGDFTVSLTPASTLLQEVVVEAKPEFKSEAGKFVFTPGDLVKRVHKVEDILMYMPMVNVKEQGVIEIFGAQKTTVYINGKEPRGMMADVKTVLRSFPPSCIKRIEIIKNPDASVGSSYSGAILNIVLTYPWEGFVGVANVQGIWMNNMFNTHDSFSAFYTKGKWAFSYRASYMGYGADERIVYEYDYKTPTQHGVEALVNESRNWKWINNLFNYFTVNYNFTEKSMLGVSVGLHNLGYHQKSDSKSTYTTSSEVYSTTTSFRDTVPFDKLRIGGNLFYTLQTDDRGSQFDVVLGYTVHTTPTNTGMYYPSTTLYQRKNSFKLGWGGKMGYRRKFNNDVSLETGVSFNSSRTDDALDFYTNSNRFVYKENLMGIYGQLAFPVKRVSFSVGLRLEPEFSRCEQRATGENYDRRFFAWCPNLSVNWAMPWRGQSLSATVRRSVHRPSISSLNPFKVWTNENSYSQGNPNMKPYYDWSFSASYVPLKSMVVSASCYLYEADCMQLTMPDANGLMATGWYDASGPQISVYADCEYTRELTSFWALKGRLWYSFSSLEVNAETEMISNIRSDYGFSIENIFNFSNRHGLFGRIRYGLSSPISTIRQTDRRWRNGLSVTLDKTWRNWTFSLGAYHLIPTHTKYTFNSEVYEAHVEHLRYCPVIDVGVNYVFGNRRTKTVRTINSDADSRFGSNY